MMKLYLASPWFTEDQDRREKEVKAKLREIGFNVFSPREESVLSANASKKDQDEVFRIDLEGINTADAVFAITNDKDMGTLFECGYAYANGLPIIYYAEGLSGKFNLMLARSASLVYTDINNINSNEILDAICGITKEYEGEIE